MDDPDHHPVALPGQPLGLTEEQDLVMEIVELQIPTQSQDELKLEMMVDAPIDGVKMSSRTGGNEIRLKV